MAAESLQPGNLATIQPCLSAIIVAAGSSIRAGFDKITAPLDGLPVLAYSLAAFDASDAVREVVLVVRNDREAEMRRVCEQSNVQKPIVIVAGGEHRQDSVSNGLEAIDSDAKYVAVHDAARPLVTSELIRRVFAKAEECGAASAAEPVNDTLKRADAAFKVDESISRDGLFAMQTPQIFERGLLENAYHMVKERRLHITDEVTAVQQLGREVVLVPHDDFNFKITRARDLKLAELVLRSRS